jgi:hypothetical protein
VPGDGLDWTGTRSLNDAEWQKNLVEIARGWTGLDWTGLEPGLPMFENGSERLVDFIWIYVD